MCLAIMAWAVCWKKVLMKNPLNVLVEIYGILGNFAKVSIPKILVVDQFQQFGQGVVLRQPVAVAA